MNAYRSPSTLLLRPSAHRLTSKYVEPRHSEAAAIAFSPSTLCVVTNQCDDVTRSKPKPKTSTFGWRWRRLNSHFICNLVFLDAALSIDRLIRFWIGNEVIVREWIIAKMIDLYLRRGLCSVSNFANKLERIIIIWNRSTKERPGHQYWRSTRYFKTYCERFTLPRLLFSY